MNYNMITVTFWFNEIENFKELQNILDEELKAYFSPFNLTGVPMDFDPIIPRITSRTIGGHTDFNMSKINIQLSTRFDRDFTTDLKKCYDYIKEKTDKIFSILSSKCNINILYSAVQINFEYEQDNPIKRIVENFCNKEYEDDYEEIGFRYSKAIDNKYYYNFSINDAKVVSFTKKIEQGTKKQTIIIPLIPEKDVNIDKKVLAFVVEINDKCNYNKVSNYHTDKQVVDDMFDTFYKKISELVENVNEGKIM